VVPPSADRRARQRIAGQLLAESAGRRALGSRLLPANRHALEALLQPRGSSLATPSSMSEFRPVRAAYLPPQSSASPARPRRRGPGDRSTAGPWAGRSWCARGASGPLRASLSSARRKRKRFGNRRRTIEVRNRVRHSGSRADCESPGACGNRRIGGRALARDWIHQRGRADAHSARAKGHPQEKSGSANKLEKQPKDVLPAATGSKRSPPQVNTD